MLWTVEELKNMEEFKGIPSETLKQKMSAIEVAIKGYTNNKFQNKKVRFESESRDNVLFSYNDNIKPNDTIEISQSISNNGLYVVTEIKDKNIYVDNQLSENEYNLVTKIEHPKDILEGSLSMLKWNLDNADKIGVASESLSRHSVTYFNMDKTNTVSGYPISIMGFCTPYMRAKTWKK